MKAATHATFINKGACTTGIAIKDSGQPGAERIGRTPLFIQEDGQRNRTTYNERYPIVCPQADLRPLYSALVTVVNTKCEIKEKMLCGCANVDTGGQAVTLTVPHAAAVHYMHAQ